MKNLILAIFIGSLGFVSFLTLKHALYLLPQVLWMPPAGVLYLFILAAQISGSGKWGAAKSYLKSLFGHHLSNREKTEIVSLMNLLVVGLYCCAGLILIASVMKLACNLDRLEEFGPIILVGFAGATWAPFIHAVVFAPIRTSLRERKD